MDNHINAFTDAMRNAGVNPTEPIIADSKLHRFHVEGDRKGTSNGAYILYMDNNPAGWWQHFKTGISGTWTATGKREPMTPAMKRQIEAARQQRQAEQAKTQAKAAEKARQIWHKAAPINDPSEHPYLVKKRIQPHGVKLYGDALVIPIDDETGAIVNLQFIQPDSSKRFLSGGRKKGCFHQIGTPTGTILICEGYATGASLYEATGHYVIVAMDAGNLESVAKVIRQLFPNEKIILCADNDPIGIEKASIAAYSCNGLYIAPPGKDTDFNDYINQGGKVYG